MTITPLHMGKEQNDLKLKSRRWKYILPCEKEKKRKKTWLVSNYYN